VRHPALLGNVSCLEKPPAGKFCTLFKGRILNRPSYLPVIRSGYKTPCPPAPFKISGQDQHASRRLEALGLSLLTTKITLHSCEMALVCAGLGSQSGPLESVNKPWRSCTGVEIAASNQTSPWLSGHYVYISNGQP
jgi:hypothetical protein